MKLAVLVLMILVSVVTVRAEFITNSVSDRPYIEEKQALEVSNNREAYLVKRSGVLVTKTDKGLEKIQDFDNGITTVYYNGKKIEPIIDNPNQIDMPVYNPEAEVLLVYPRFDIYVDSAFYYNNETELLQLIDNFLPRYNLLENRTGWSSEKFYGQKLQINVFEATAGCWEGTATPATVNMNLNSPFGLCSQEIYLEGMIHETLHSINPLPLYFRDWLTEGWSQYEQYNTLVAYGDYTQTQADDFIETGHVGVYGYTQNYVWANYTTNDYHDTSPNNYEIQLSNGYDITAWMYTMMRNDHSIQFSDVYALMEENHETLDKSLDWHSSLNAHTDMVVIDLFGRAAGYDFNETKDIWEYDGPSGPGWGVRQWVSTDWYGDAQPFVRVVFDSIDFDIDIQTTIKNNGEVSFVDMPVNIYANGILIDSIFVDIPALDSVMITNTFPTNLWDTNNVEVIVDEYNIKIESNEYNNMDNDNFVHIYDYDNDGYYNVFDCDDLDSTINPGALDIPDDGIDQDCSGTDATCCSDPTGDINNDGSSQADISDLLYLVDYMFTPGSPAPECSKEADVNGDGGLQPDISDLLYLVDYMFTPGAPAPADCQ